ncbi:MAG: hypothetical protein WA738_04990 [Candidatus Angelobacter sp.]
MIAACLLLIIAIAGGTLLTFLFDHNAPGAARICLGACLGLPLMASIGFLLALAMGLTATSVTLSAVVLLLPFLLLLRRSYRQLVFINLFSRRAASLTSGRNVAYLLFYVAIGILLGLVFDRAVFIRPDGIFTGIVNNLGDLPLHLQIINSFAQGQNIPPVDPTYTGVRFAYPFLVDFLAAMLVRAGASVIAAMWIQNMALGLALMGSMHYWTLLLTRNRLAGIIAPMLVLFSGGLGWWLLFSDPVPNDGVLSLLANLPHDYTIVPNSLLRWGNSMTTLFVPQRSILFGLPLAIFIFCQWWMAISQQETALAPAKADAGQSNQMPGPRKVVHVSSTARRKMALKAAAPAEPQSISDRRMLAAGLAVGLLPLIHAHTFLVVMSVAVCLALIFQSVWRSWLLFFAVAIPVSLPEILWLANTGGVNAKSYLGWQPGWDHADHNVLWFWLANTGLFIPLLVAALLWRRTDFALPQRLLKFYAPFLFCFIIPNLVKLAPWVWDNIKVLFVWYIASTPLVALLLAKWWAQKSFWRWLAPPLLATLIFAGVLDVLRVVTASTEYLEFDRNGIAVADAISREAAPGALVLHAPTYNSPVFLTGRRSLLGYPGWMWSRGLDYSQRSADIQSIYSGGPDANALLRRYGVDYVLLGPAELASFKVDETFWSRYMKLAQAGPYRLYKINGGPQK